MFKGKITAIFMKMFICLLLACAALYPQQNQKIIAKIGNISISENEFKARYELVPRINLQTDDKGVNGRKNFLYGLITEKLLSFGAHESKLDTIETVRNTISIFEKMFVRDALYKKEVVEKSRNYADSLLSFYLDASSKMFTRFIVYKDSIKIQNIYKRLTRGASFDTIYNSLSKYEKDTATIRLGTFEDNVERHLFVLNEKSISKPVKIDDGWYLFEIIQKNDPIAKKTETWETDFNQMKKTAKEKAEEKFYQQYISAFFKKKKIEANGFLLKSFADKVCSVLAEKEKVKLKGQNLYLETADIAVIEKMFGSDSLNKVFVKLTDHNILLRDYLQWYKFENFSAANSNYKTIASLLNGKTKKFIEQEMLYQQGVKEGLNKAPEVLADINMWKDSYLSQVVSASFYDSVQVTDGDIKKYTEQTTSDTSAGDLQINIAEVLTDDLATVEKVLNELSAGADIHQLAAQYSKREEYKANNGESGFVSIYQLGEIGRIASSMQPDEVYGPLKVNEGYSVFKLIGKRNNEIKSNTGNDAELKSQVFYSKMKDKLHSYTAQLAKKYGIETNDNELASVKLTKIKSLVYRNLGFGGKITAVPFNSADIDWVKEYKEKNNL